MILRPWTGTSGPRSFPHWVAWGGCSAFQVLGSSHANTTGRSVRQNQDTTTPVPHGGPAGQGGPPPAGTTVLHSAAVGALPIGPRLDAEPELCCAGCPTSWLTEGSLLIPPPWTLFIGERTGP